MRWMIRTGFVLALVLQTSALAGDDAQSDAVEFTEGPAASSLPESGPDHAEELLPPTDDRTTLSFRVEGYARHSFSRDLKDTAGDLSISRVGGEGAMSWVPSERLRLTFIAGYEYADYEFGGAASLIPGNTKPDPVDPLHQVSLALNGSYGLDSRWGVFGGIFARASWEQDADVAESWTGGGFIGGSYTFKDNLTIGLGVGAFTRLEDDPWLFPAIIVRWQATEKLRIENERLGGRITYTFTPDLDVYGTATYRTRDYRLARDRFPLAGGVIRDTYLPVGVGLTWRPVGGLSMSFEGGVIVFQELEFQDGSGNDISSNDVNSTGYLAFTLRYTF